MIRKLILASFLLGLGACSSNPHKAKKLDMDLDHAQKVNGNSKIGVKDGEMVHQTEVEMKEELRRLEINVYSLEDRVYGNRKYGSEGLYGVLKKCRLDLSNEVNGGNGKLKWTEPLERITDKEDNYKVGLSKDKKLVGVSREYLRDRIQRYKGYQHLLHKREDEYKEKVEVCENNLRSQKYRAKGH